MKLPWVSRAEYDRVVAERDDFRRRYDVIMDKILTKAETLKRERGTTASLRTSVPNWRQRKVDFTRKSMEPEPEIFEEANHGTV